MSRIREETHDAERLHTCLLVQPALPFPGPS